MRSCDVLLYRAAFMSTEGADEGSGTITRPSSLPVLERGTTANPRASSAPKIACLSIPTVAYASRKSVSQIFCLSSQAQGRFEVQVGRRSLD